MNSGQIKGKKKGIDRQWKHKDKQIEREREIESERERESWKAEWEIS